MPVLPLLSASTTLSSSFSIAPGPDSGTQGINGGAVGLFSFLGVQDLSHFDMVAQDPAPDGRMAHRGEQGANGQGSDTRRYTPMSASFPSLVTAFRENIRGMEQKTSLSLPLPVLPDNSVLQSLGLAVWGLGLCWRTHHLLTYTLYPCTVIKKKRTPHGDALQLGLAAAFDRMSWHLGKRTYTWLVTAGHSWSETGLLTSTRVAPRHQRGPCMRRGLKFLFSR
jgi:hypothetical protein